MNVATAATTKIVKAMQAALWIYGFSTEKVKSKIDHSIH